MILRQWTCDTCGEQVERPEDGIVVWRDREAGPEVVSLFYDFMIVHRKVRSPGPESCDPGSRQGYAKSVDLPHFLGPDGLAMLLSWLSPGPLKGGGAPRVAAEDMDAYVNFVRRVQTPYYEQARPRLGEQQTYDLFGDANEYYPYRPESLNQIASFPPAP